MLLPIRPVAVIATNISINAIGTDGVDLTSTASRRKSVPAAFNQILGHKRRAIAEPGGDCDQPAVGLSDHSRHQRSAEEPVTPQIQVEHLLHSTIIASASAYFKLHLTTDVGKESDAPGITKYDLHEDVDPEQVEAAGAVLELMYKQKVPSGLDIKMMLAMLQVRVRVREIEQRLNTQNYLPDDASSLWLLSPRL